MSGSFKTLQPQLTAATRDASIKSKNFALHNIIRAQFKVQTWLALGAIVQVSLFALPVRRYLAAAPAIVYLLFTIVDHILMLFGVRKNIFDAQSIQTKYTALLPSEDGSFDKVGSKSQKVAVFMLGFRSNHVLGPLAPGAADINEYAQKMFDELDENAAKYGFLGQATYLNGKDSETSPDIMTLQYFRSLDDVIRYSQSDLHRQGWNWFNRHTKQYKHLGISHELYEAPAGKWENVFLNTPPTGIATTRHHIIDAKGNEKWVSPIVKAEGKLSSTHGRWE